MPDWVVGLSTGSCWQSNIFECLEDIRNSGFWRIEVRSHPGHLDYHNVEIVKQAAQRVESLGLEIYSFHAPFAETIDITSFDPNARALAIGELIRAAEAAAILGARYFVVHPGPEKTALPEHERLQRLENGVGVLNQAETHCQKLGVQLMLENMLPHLFAGRTRDLLWILGALESTQVGICLDTGHAHLGEELPRVAHKLSGHLRMVHASDNYRHRDDHLPPGDGGIPWPGFLRQLFNLEFDGTFILEVAAQSDRKATLDGARRGRKYLERLFRTLSHAAETTDSQ